jgi:S-layer protein (TIGR01567 family)
MLIEVVAAEQINSSPKSIHTLTGSSTPTHTENASESGYGVSTIDVGSSPAEIAVNLDETKVNVTNVGGNTASAIIETLGTENPGNMGVPVNDSIEVRSPVYDGYNLQSIISNVGGRLTMDATNFAAIFYDIDSNMSTETLSIRSVPGTSGNVIGEGGLVYETKIGWTDFQFVDWGKYNVLGLFGNIYIPLKSDDASKLAKLVLDSDDKHTLRTGEKLDLGQGYMLEVKLIDVANNKVLLEFTKDGQYVDDHTISIDTGDQTWTCTLDNIQGETNVPVMKVHVSHALEGQNYSIIQINGLWLIDYANATKIEADDEFGRLNDVVLNGSTISISNKDTFTLTKGSDQEIGQEMYFKIADDPNALRFYVFKKIADLGTHEIRGQVASGTGPQTWDATNFAGFYYDFNDNVATETLAVFRTIGNVIPENGLFYSTTIQKVKYQYKDWNATYPVLGFFGEQYIPIRSNDASKVAKLVLDSNDKYTLGAGEKLDLGQGYVLEVKLIDIANKKVWLEFTKDGQYVDDEIVNTNTGDQTWTCVLDKILGEDDVPVLKVHVNQVSQGAVGRIALIDGLWLIDYVNSIKIEADNEFGRLNDVSLRGDTIVISNEDTFTLTRGSNQEIGMGIIFKVADTPYNELRYYPFVEKSIGESDSMPLTAAFSTNVTNGQVPLSVQFTDLSQKAISREWDFNGDGTADSVDVNPVYTYTIPGNYTVNLTVNNTNGTASESATITVLSKPTPPVSSIYTNPPTDLNHDGRYEDVNGNGIQDFDDIVAYYDNMDWIGENASVGLFDYNNNSLIDFDDVVRLYDML